MANTLVLVRHGQSQANAGGLFCGLLDVPLTDFGREEAVYAAECHYLPRFQRWIGAVHKQPLPA